MEKQLLDTTSEIFGDKASKSMKEIEGERDHLYQQIGKLQVEVEWLKKDRTSVMSVAEKRACIEPEHKSLSI